MKTATFRAASLAVAFGAALTLGACTVDKTQEGEMPKVDVDVAAEGGQLPAYDVDAPEVDVTTKEVQVAVPEVNVTTETETVTVPEVDVTPAGQDGN